MLAEHTIAINHGLTVGLPVALNDAQDYGSFKGFCQSFHSSRIVGIDAVAQQPLVVAVAEDKTVRVWDYYRKASIVCKQLLEEPLCCSLHPSGFMLLVGSMDKLRMFYILQACCSHIKLCSLIKHRSPCFCAVSTSIPLAKCIILLALQVASCARVLTKIMWKKTNPS